MNQRWIVHIGKYVPPPPGGIEYHTDALLRTMAPHVAVGLLAARSPVDPEADPNRGYPIWAVANWGKIGPVTFSPGVLTQLMQLLRQGKVAGLHLHLPNPWADFAAQLVPPDLPIIVSWHSDIVRPHGLYRLYRPLQQATLHRADAVIVAGPGHLRGSRQLLPAANGKIHFVPYGIDVESLHPDRAAPDLLRQLRAWAGTATLIASVGRHVYYKGYSWLLQALARMTSPARLVLVGRGPLTQRLRRQATQLGLAQRIWWIEQADPAQVVAVLQACDVFALPSVEPSEAFGLASAEAMACGKPTVVCALGNGVEDLNQHGHTSLVVPPRDPAALALALDTLAADPGLRQAMGRHAAAWVRTRYSLQAMRDATLKVYRTILGRLPAPSASHPQRWPDPGEPACRPY